MNDYEVSNKSSTDKAVEHECQWKTEEILLLKEPKGRKEINVPLNKETSSIFNWQKNVNVSHCIVRE